QRHLADLTQVEAQRVEAGLDGEVELRRLLAVDQAVLLGLLLGLPVEQLDVVVEQVGVEVLELFLGELDLLERLGDLVEREVPLVLAFLDKSLQLLDVRQRDLDRQHWRPRTCSNVEENNSST